MAALRLAVPLAVALGHDVGRCCLAASLGGAAYCLAVPLAMSFGCIIGWCRVSFGIGIWPCYRPIFSSSAEGGSKKKPPAGDGATSLVEFVRLTSSSVYIDDAAMAARKRLCIPSGNLHLNNNGGSMSGTSSDGMELAQPSFGTINSV